MDARFEPLQQEVLNQVISLMNRYIRENVDDVVSHPDLLANFRAIAKAIYTYTEMFVDVEDTLVNKNLLSIDTVPLPLITDQNFAGISHDKEKFLQLMADIDDVMVDRNERNIIVDDFYRGISSIINRYKPKQEGVMGINRTLGSEIEKFQKEQLAGKQNGNIKDLDMLLTDVRMAHTKDDPKKEIDGILYHVDKIVQDAARDNTLTTEERSLISKGKDLVNKGCTAQLEAQKPAERVMGSELPRNTPGRGA